MCKYIFLVPTSVDLFVPILFIKAPLCSECGIKTNFVISFHFLNKHERQNILFFHFEAYFNVFQCNEGLNK